MMDTTQLTDFIYLHYDKIYNVSLIFIVIMLYFRLAYLFTYDPYLLKYFGKTVKNDYKMQHSLIKNDMKDFEIYYKDRDMSHGINHVIAVAKRALKYADHYGLTDNEKKIIRKAALLHDAYDHKYVQDSEKIKRRINRDLRKQDCKEIEIYLIHNMIENISFSTEKKNRDKRYPAKKVITFRDPHQQLMRDIVSDADKYEAIGEMGIIRMIEYYNHKNKDCKDKFSDKWYKEFIDHLKKHSEEKLFRLIPDNYIRTSIGIKEAQVKEKELREIINNESLLIKLICNNS